MENLDEPNQNNIEDNIEETIVIKPKPKIKKIKKSNKINSITNL